MGQYEISDVANMTVELYRRFGKIVRLTGLIGRPDLLFVNDADEIEKVGHQHVHLNSDNNISDSPVNILFESPVTVYY